MLPPQSGRGKGIKGMIYGLAQKQAGAGLPSPDRIILLRDADGDGATRHIGIPRGSEFAVRHGPGRQRPLCRRYRCGLRFAYTRARPGSTTPGVKVADLPGGPINHHWTKNLIASRDGSKLYATVGSNSNVGENGMDKEEDRAANLGDRSRERSVAGVRHRPAQSQRYGLGAADRRAVDGR